MTSADTAPTSTAGLQTLLVVEHEILIRFPICDYLRECGFRVIEAANADEAIIVLQAPDLTIDLVLSDVQMPGAMDGFGLAQWVRTNNPGIPVVLVGSAAKAADAAADLCENGPMLAKPYEPQVLLDQIKRVLAGRLASGNGLDGKAKEAALDAVARAALGESGRCDLKPPPMQDS